MIQNMIQLGISGTILAFLAITSRFITFGLNTPLEIRRNSINVMSAILWKKVQYNNLLKYPPVIEAGDLLGKMFCDLCQGKMSNLYQRFWLDKISGVVSDSTSEQIFSNVVYPVFITHASLYVKETE